MTLGSVVADAKAGQAQASNFAMANVPMSNCLYSYDIVFEDGASTDRFLLRNCR